ncbi:hypothetical protein LC612_31120 [Nostoc sp. CHAB 5834]|nr:hypothetical protein [Nostoc sp. CHAB 5834]
MKTAFRWMVRIALLFQLVGMVTLELTKGMEEVTEPLTVLIEKRNKTEERVKIIP